MEYIENYVDEMKYAVDNISLNEVNKIIDILETVKKECGRVFIIGSGGSASNASHAVCDFRKLCKIEAYTPYDNIAELTARTNDEGWENTISEWLKISNISEKDCIFVFSVGGGCEKESVSPNIIKALELASEKNSKIVGVVSEIGGYTSRAADAVVKIAVQNKSMLTPITESFQSFVWHMLVTNPRLQENRAKWESIL